MTGRERILRAIRHEESDTVPVAPRVWAWMLDYYGDYSLSTYLRMCEGFGGDAGVLVLREDGVQDPVGDLVSNLVWMAFRNGFGSE